MLKDGERIDDLQYEGLKLIQKEGGYTFTSDAVLLANLVRPCVGKRLVDLGTGSGVVALLATAKKKPRETVGVELQPRLADMARRSIALNRLEDKISVWEGDMRFAPEALGIESFEVATANPPYWKTTVGGEVSEVPNEREICCREYKITLEEVVETAAKLLKYGGLFYVVVKGERLVDLLSAMRRNLLEPKRLIPVQPTPEKKIDTVVVEGKKGAKGGIVIEKPFLVMDERGEYTPEAKELYCLC